MNDYDDEDELAEQELRAFSSRYDAEVDTDQFRQPRRRRREESPERGEGERARSRSISPLRAPGPRPHGEGDPFEPPGADPEYVVLDDTLRQRSDQEENREELARWATLLRKTNYQPGNDDVDFSDDEYEVVPVVPQRHEGQGEPQPEYTSTYERMLKFLRPYAEIQDELSSQLSRLQMHEFESGARQILDEDDAWAEFWRLKDRDWCFMCSHRNSYSESEYLFGFREIQRYCEDPKRNEYNFERIVRIIQDIFFCQVQRFLPPRRKCRITGKGRPPHFLWRSMIRKHITEHLYLPIHDQIRMSKQYAKISHAIKTRLITRLRKDRDEYSVDSKLLQDSLKCDSFLLKLHDSIQGRLASAGTQR